MSVMGGYDPGEALLLMTLSAYAYIDATPLPGETIPHQEGRMRTDVDAALAATAQTAAWRVVWGPALNEDGSNMMFVAGNAAAGQCAVAVRGTVWSFWLDWLEDFTSVLPLVDYPYLSPTSGSQPRIAAGTSVGLEQLTAMTWTDGPGEGSDLATFLHGTPATAAIFVTGHSLGGCLASALAPWLASKLGSAGRLKIYTFAAPSAGNGAFATQYDTLFTDAAHKKSTALRVYNSLDVVPNAWASLPTVETYYTPFPPCPQDVKSLIQRVLADVGTTYVQVGSNQTGGTHELPGHIIIWPEATAQLNLIGDGLFLYEAAEQHGSRNYLKLLQAEPVDATAAKLRGTARRLGLAT